MFDVGETYASIGLRYFKTRFTVLLTLEKYFKILYKEYDWNKFENNLLTPARGGSKTATISLSSGRVRIRSLRTISALPE